MSLPNTIIIPHGSTEQRLVKWMLNELRTNAVIYRPYDNKKTVSMKEIKEILMQPPFDRPENIHKKFEDIQYDKKFKELTIVPVLDVDCDSRSFGMYRSKDMFREFCLGKNNIIPIYNNPKIETVLEKAGYGKIAHNLEDFQNFLDSTDIEEFREHIRTCEYTNMEILIDHLCKFVPRYQK